MNAYKQEFMDRAVWLAGSHLRAGVRGGGPFGAVVVKDGAIVGEGFQQVIALKDPTAHAEILAIRDACRRLGSRLLDGCELYATYVPCPMCLSASRWARIDRIYYAADGLSDIKINNADFALYEELKNPDKGVKVESSTEAVAQVMQAWREHFCEAGK